MRRVRTSMLPPPRLRLIAFASPCPGQVSSYDGMLPSQVLFSSSTAVVFRCGSSLSGFVCCCFFRYCVTPRPKTRDLKRPLDDQHMGLQVYKYSTKKQRSWVNFVAFLAYIMLLGQHVFKINSRCVASIKPTHACKRRRRDRSAGGPTQTRICRQVLDSKPERARKTRRTTATPQTTDDVMLQS